MAYIDSAASQIMHTAITSWEKGGKIVNLKRMRLFRAGRALAAVCFESSSGADVPSTTISPSESFARVYTTNANFCFNSIATLSLIIFCLVCAIDSIPPHLHPIRTRLSYDFQ